MQTRVENVYAVSTTNISDGFVQKAHQCQRHIRISSDKLESNYVPSEEEADQITKFLHSEERRIGHMEAEISQLEDALQNLKKARDQLKEVIDAHRALLSPMRRLLPEVLQLIFVFCLPQKRNAVMHSSEAPILLGRICSQWRALALNTPKIWSSLHIVPPNINLDSSLASRARIWKKCDIITTWLSRAKARPLDISFFWLMNNSKEEQDLCSNFLNTLLPFHRQWRDIDFQIPFEHFTPLIGLAADDVPMLEIVKIVDKNPLTHLGEYIWPEGLRFIDNLSTLRRFALVHHPGGTLLPSIPWSQLTELFLETNVGFFFTDPQDMLSALQLCVNLEKCTLKFPISLRQIETHYQALCHPFELPHLHTLVIDGDQRMQDSFHMTNIIANFQAPSLRTLELTGRHGDIREANHMSPILALEAFLAKSRCPLSQLTLRSLSVTSSEVIACLLHIPTLTEFCLYDRTYLVGIDDENILVQDEVLCALTVPLVPVANILCPVLRKAEFDYVSPTAMWEFVNSRRRCVGLDGVVPLESFRCVSTRYLDPEMNAKVQAMRMEGFEWSITYNTQYEEHSDPSPWHGLDIV